MSRIDKVDSAIGVVRAEWAADINLTTYPVDSIVGVSIDSAGKAVAGAAGQTGFVGLTIVNKIFTKAGTVAEIFKHAEIVDIPGLAAGRKYYLDATGKLTVTGAAGLVYAGYTVEADRLVLSGFGGVVFV